MKRVMTFRINDVMLKRLRQQSLVQQRPLSNIIEDALKKHMGMG